MKNKEMILLIVIAILGVFGVKAWAAFKLDSITFDLKDHRITESYVGGDMVSVNKIITNGDIIQTNFFNADGSSYKPTYNDPSESDIISGLIQRQSINVDDVTNSTMGQTGLVLGGYDKTVIDLNASN